MKQWIFIFFTLFSLQNAIFADEDSIVIETLKGSETLPYLQTLMELRLSFFREAPYLYEGTLAEEEKYVQMYSAANDSLFAVAKEGNNVIGMITGLPFTESKEQNQRLVDQISVSPHGFYLGEVVFLGTPSDHLKQKLYQAFEESIKKLSCYDSLFVCEIEREPGSSDGPSTAMSWEEHGFVRDPNLSVIYPWQEIGNEAESDHLMVFWKKELFSCKKND